MKKNKKILLGFIVIGLFLLSNFVDSQSFNSGYPIIDDYSNRMALSDNKTFASNYLGYNAELKAYKFNKNEENSQEYTAISDSITHNVDSELLQLEIDTKKLNESKTFETYNETIPNSHLYLWSNDFNSENYTGYSPYYNLDDISGSGLHNFIDYDNGNKMLYSNTSSTYLIDCNATGTNYLTQYGQFAVEFDFCLLEDFVSDIYLLQTREVVVYSIGNYSNAFRRIGIRYWNGITYTYDLINYKLNLNQFYRLSFVLSAGILNHVWVKVWLNSEKMLEKDYTDNQFFLQNTYIAPLYNCRSVLLDNFVIHYKIASITFDDDYTKDLRISVMKLYVYNNRTLGTGITQEKYEINIYSVISIINFTYKNAFNFLCKRNENSAVPPVFNRYLPYDSLLLQISSISFKIHLNFMSFHNSTNFYTTFSIFESTKLTNNIILFSRKFTSIWVDSVLVGAKKVNYVFIYLRTAYYNFPLVERYSFLELFRCIYQNITYVDFNYINNSIFSSGKNMYNCINPNGYIFTFDDSDIEVIDVSMLDSNPYWIYLTWTNIPSYSEVVHIESINYTFTYITSEQIIVKYYYEDSIMNGGSQDWGYFNALKDGLFSIVNYLYIMLQFFLYILVFGINLLFGYLLFALILPFLNNTVLYYLIFALIYAFFYIMQITNYFISVILPIIIDYMLIIISWIFALLLYALSLGTADINVLQNTVLSFLNLIAQTFLEIITIIADNIIYFIAYIGTYILLLGFIYLKYMYAKAKGYMNRAYQLESSIDAYMIPIRLLRSIFTSIKEAIFNWV